MALLDGIHHVATLTADLDRLIDFYRRDFDAPAIFDEEEDGVRHAFILLGPNTLLHPFQLSWTEPPPRHGESRCTRLATAPLVDRSLGCAGKSPALAWYARTSELERAVRRVRR